MQTVDSPPKDSAVSDICSLAIFDVAAWCHARVA